VKQIREFNRTGTPAWFFNGKILRRRGFGLFQIWMLNWLTPLFRIIDPFLPVPGLSLIAVLELSKVDDDAISLRAATCDESLRVEINQSDPGV
jgi:hypothetical protein